MVYDANILKDLVRERSNMDQQIKSKMETLNSLGVGMEKGLVDNDGFPLPDLDLYTIRQLRGETKRLLNDHKEITSKIEEMLPLALAAGTRLEQDTLEPFAKVDKVLSGSAAQLAGILVNDLVIKFGTITRERFTNMASISQIVNQHRDAKSPLHITIRRTQINPSSSSTHTDQTFIIKISDSLGCHIVPI